MTDRFAELAATWDDHPIPTAIAASLFAFIEARGLDADADVIDYGCGTGLLGLRLAERVASLHGMDASPSMLDVARQKATTLGLGNVTLSEHAFGDRPLPSGAADLVTASMVLHHIADVPAFFAACFDTVRPGGAVAFADLDTEDGSFHPPHAEGVHHHGFDRAQLAEWLTAAGFAAPQFDTVHTVDREGRAYPVFGLWATRPAP